MSTNAQLSAHSTRETRCRKGAKETGDDIQIAPIMHRNRFPPKNDYCGKLSTFFVKVPPQVCIDRPFFSRLNG